MPAKKARKLPKADVRVRATTTARRNLKARNAASKTKSVVMHLENVAMPPEKVEVNLKVLRLTKRKANQAAKSVAIPTPAARKTIGDSSFKATTRSSVIKSPISAKKAGQDGHLRRND